jgi:sugar lactone lactonase YvrE
LYLSDWGTGEILALGPDGQAEVAARVESFPLCFDFLPDGRLLALESSGGRLLRQERDGDLMTHADLDGIAEFSWNEIAVDARGNAYLNNIGFDFPDGEYGPGFIQLVAADGTTRRVADELAFPNGMVITPDGSTLIVAESYANALTAFEITPDGGLTNRRTWAEVAGPPDGICLDAEGAIWYGDVPNQRCVRVAEGGAVLQSVELDRGCFACALGGPDGRTLFLVANVFGGDESAGPQGQVLAVDAPVSAVDAR